MIPSFSKANFRVKFPTNLIPPEISNRYRAMLENIPGNTITDPLEMMNFSFQSVDIEGLDMDNISQTFNRGEKLVWRNPARDIKLFSLAEAPVTFTFLLLDGCINWAMMVEVLTYYYNTGSQRYIPEGLSIETLSYTQIPIIRFEVEEGVFQSISNLSLDFSSNTVENPQFTIAINAKYLNFSPEVFRDNTKIIQPW